MKRFVVVIIVCLSLVYGAFPQKKDSSAQSDIQDKKPEANADDSFNLRIVELLRQTADEAKNWDNVKISSRTQAQVADLIWDYDPIFAESYLIRAWDKAKQAKEPSEKPSQFRNYSNRVEVSREVLLTARKRQPELAEKWLKELSDSAEKDFADRNKGLFDDRTTRSAVLLQMAMQSAETDVQAAAALAAESLKDEISFGFQSVLIKIQEKNPELAQQVFRAALQRINRTGIESANELQILYSYLYTPGRVTTTANASSSSSATIAVGRDQPRIISAAQLNPALAQEFLLAAGRAVLRMPFLIGTEDPQTAAREQFGIINTILSRLGNSAPELSAALRERLSAIVANANFSAESPTAPNGIKPIQQGESRDDYQNRLLDEAMEKSEKINDLLGRDIFAAQALLRSDAEQFVRAKGFADKISDKELREQIVSFLIYRVSLYRIKNSEIDEAYKILQKNNEPRQRAASLIVGGQKLLEQNSISEAQDWFGEAQKLFEKNKSKDEDWINIGFGLVNGFARFDKLSALKQLEDTTKLIKKETSKYSLDRAPLAIGFSGLDFSDFTVGTNNFSLGSAIKAFSKQEFESVLSSFDKIPNFQAKADAAITLARKHLKPPMRKIKTQTK